MDNSKKFEDNVEFEKKCKPFVIKALKDDGFDIVDVFGMNGVRPSLIEFLFRNKMNMDTAYDVFNLGKCKVCDDYGVDLCVEKVRKYLGSNYKCRFSVQCKNSTARNYEEFGKYRKSFIFRMSLLSFHWVNYYFHAYARNGVVDDLNGYMSDEIGGFVDEDGVKPILIDGYKFRDAIERRVFDLRTADKDQDLWYIPYSEIIDSGVGRFLGGGGRDVFSSE